MSTPAEIAIAEEFETLLNRYFETFGAGPALHHLPHYAERNAALRKALDTGELLLEPDEGDDRIY